MMTRTITRNNGGYSLYSRFRSSGCSAMNLAIIGFSIADSDTPMFLRILYNVFFIFSGTFVILISQFSEVSFFLL